MDKLKLKIFGASHSKKIGFKLKGLPVGLKINHEEIKKFLDRRRAGNYSYSTKRIEPDEPIFTKGVQNDRVVGDIECEILNTNYRRNDYNYLKDTPRPSHADYSAYLKYNGKLDMSGGGPFSGRLTANYCIAGAICNQILKDLGITVKSYISKIGNVKGKSYKDLSVAELENLNVPQNNFPLLDESVKDKMQEHILFASNNLDSVGGVIETVIGGNIGGLGGNFFDCLEGAISSNVFAVPAVKGIEFGAGFDITDMFGSGANDALYYNGNVVKTKTNNNGGINGGIANGMPICFSVAIKPTPSIAREQDTVNLATKENVKIKIMGRHDSCITPRAVVVIESVTILALTDIILKEKLWKN